MRTRPVLAAAAAATSLLASGAAVAAAPGCSDVKVITSRTPLVTETVEACRADRWLTGSAGKADNVAPAYPTWDDSKPTASVRAGAGSGYATLRAVEIVRSGDRLARPVFQGTFTGVLDNLAADLYLSSPVYSATETPFPMLLTVKVDGQTVYTKEDAEVDVPMEPNPTETTGTGATQRIRFAVTGIAQAMQDLEMPLDGQHTVSISITNRYFGDGNSVFLYDTAEVPAGVVFNHPKGAGSGFNAYTQVKAG